MSDLNESRTESGEPIMSTIRVEVVPSAGRSDPSGLVTRRALPTIEDFSDRAGDIADSVTEIAGSIQERIDDARVAAVGGEWAMDAITLSFALNLEAGAGVVIAKASASATFTVEINWRRTTR